MAGMMFERYLVACVLCLGLCASPIQGQAAVSYDACTASGIGNFVLVDDYSGSYGSTVALRRDALVFLREGNNVHTDHFRCSGTLIDETRILAAGHCSGVNRAGFLFDDPALKTTSGAGFLSPVALYSVTKVEEGRSTTSLNGIDLDYLIVEVTSGDPTFDLGISPTMMKAYSLSPSPLPQIIDIAHPKYTGSYGGSCLTYDNCRPKTAQNASVHAFFGQQAFSFNLCAQTGASGSGALDTTGNLVGLVNQLDADRRIKAIPLPTLLHVSPILRSISGRRGVTLRASGNVTSNSTISASCGTSLGRSCSITSTSSTTWAHMESVGCSIDCPAGTQVTISCTVDGASQPGRNVDQILWQTTTPVMSGIVSQGWQYSGTHYDKFCDADSCTKSATPADWTQATCTYTD